VVHAVSFVCDELAAGNSGRGCVYMGRGWLCEGVVAMVVAFDGPAKFDFLRISTLPGARRVLCEVAHGGCQWV